MQHVTSTHQDFLNKLKEAGSLTEDLEAKLKAIVETFMDTFDPSEE